MLMLEVSEILDVFQVVTNSDLTEGRGHRVVIGHAFTLETAQRLAKRRGVMGSDAAVIPTQAFRYYGSWMVPGHIEPENDGEKVARMARLAAEAAAARALAAGLSDEDIALLRGSR